MKNNKCPYYRFLELDWTAGCIGLGMMLGFIIGFLYKAFIY